MTRPFLALSAILALVACAPADQPSPGFGNAVRQNMAAHVINPDPHPNDLPPPEFDGERTKDAFQRYREDKVKKPVPLNTTTIKGDKK
jgi:type IV pilus biogenesis protein CpaD/CtpE